MWLNVNIIVGVLSVSEPSLNWLVISLNNMLITFTGDYGWRKARVKTTGFFYGLSWLEFMILFSHLMVSCVCQKNRYLRCALKEKRERREKFDNFFSCGWGLFDDRTCTKEMRPLLNSAELPDFLSMYVTHRRKRQSLIHSRHGCIGRFIVFLSAILKLETAFGFMVICKQIKTLFPFSTYACPRLNFVHWWMCTHWLVKIEKHERRRLLCWWTMNNK